MVEFGEGARKSCLPCWRWGEYGIFQLACRISRSVKMYLRILMNYWTMVEECSQ